MGRALFSPHFEAERPNIARFIFLDPRARDFYADWPLARSLTAAMLRLRGRARPAQQRPHRPRRRAVDAQPAVPQGLGRPGRPRAPHRHGRSYRHPEVGDLEVTYDVFEMPGEPGLSITTYTAEEGSESADKLALLASWAATQGIGAEPSAASATAPGESLA